jgi:hypothetical protein
MSRLRYRSKEVWLDPVDVGGGWKVAYRLENQKGQPVIAELRVYRDTRLSAGGLEARRLRSVHVEAASLMTSSELKEWRGHHGLLIRPWYFTYDDDDEPELRYAMACVIYLDAIGKTNPIEAVAMWMGRSRARAAEVIKEARAEGLITDTRRGVAGGELTDKALRILEANFGPLK